jgi:lipopolysaccharide/colanic/teichoic acid biosynthesis glycosyltransferase
MSAHAHTPQFAGSAPAKPGIEVRRGFDCLVALAALVCLAPLLAIIAAAIWIESGGPVFFSQTRLGQGARRFRLHKFRKFSDRARPGQTQHHGLSITLWNDPRMTRVGRLLERTKLDELPQLWNIVVGEMALVGPRPESLAFASCFNGACINVLDHRPGIFGPCQAVFRNESLLYGEACDPEDFYRNVLFPLKAQIDLAYFSNRSFLSDATWIARSILAVFGWSPLPDFGNLQLDELRAWVQQLIQLTV